MPDETHNGWRNYPTWAVNMWLSNEEPLYRETISRTTNQCQEARLHDSVISGVWTVEQATRFNVADMLKEWVTDELAPDLGASFASDLLGYALGQVDWYEIADAWIEEVVCPPSTRSFPKQT